MAHSPVAQDKVKVSAALARSPTGGSITIGLAELAEDDSRCDVVACADADLLAQRQKPSP
jgi:hypothetical protein